MAAPTTKDLLDAATYATNILNDYLLSKYPEYNNYYTRTEVDWSTDELPSLQDTTKIRKKILLEFTEYGCTNTSCLGFQYDGTNCLPDTPQQTWRSIDRSNPQTYTSCQPACYKFNKNYDPEDPSPTLPSTIFREGQCHIRNPYTEMFAKAPSRRSDVQIDGTTNVPLFLMTPENEMRVTEEYCKYFATNYNGQDCYRTPGERFLSRFLFGNTLTAIICHGGDIFGRLGSYTQLIDSRILQVSSQQRILAKATREGDDEETSFWEKYPTVTFILQFLEDIGFDLITDKMLETLRYVIKATIKELATDFVFARLANMISLRFVDSVVSSTIIRRGVLDMALSSVKSVAVSMLRVASVVLKVLEYVLVIVAIASIILDIIDVFNLNRQLFQESCDVYTRQFDQLFRAAFESFDPLLTPASLIYLSRMSADDADDVANTKSETDDELALTLEYTAEYLLSLKYNSLGQIISWEDPEPSQLTPPIADVIDRQTNVTKETIEALNERNRSYVKQSSLTLVPTLLIGFAAFIGLLSQTAGLVVLILVLIILLLFIFSLDVNQFCLARTSSFLSTRVGEETIAHMHSRLTKLAVFSQFQQYSTRELLKIYKSFLGR